MLFENWFVIVFLFSAQNYITGLVMSSRQVYGPGFAAVLDTVLYLFLPDLAMFLNFLRQFEINIIAINFNHFASSGSKFF